MAILAAGVVVFIEKLDPTIYSDKTLKEVVGMPPLATVPYIYTGKEVASRQRNIYIVSTGVWLLFL